MRYMLRCRRGSAAVATVIAMVPLIGAVALGAEAGSWYVTKTHAQAAADAAAYSGGLWLACSLSSPCADPASQTLAYRGKEFAAQNGFCNANDTTYPGSQCVTSLPKGTSQNVQIASLTSWNGHNGNFVQATVSQTQPTYLAAVLGLATVTINTTAVAQVQSANAPACVLALKGSISFQGSPNINAPNCGMASNDNAPNALNFTGGGMTIDLGSLSAVGGCTGAAKFCNTALINMPAPIVNPFSVLDAVTLPTLSNCSSSSNLSDYGTYHCVNNNVDLKGNNTICLNVAGGGVYFISGTLTLRGTTTISTQQPPCPSQGTALFIMLPGASFSMKGTGTITITGNSSVPTSQLPSALQSYAGLFANMAIYDQSNNAVTIGGNSNITFMGNMYLPNAAVTFQGNPTITISGSTGCGQLVAASIAFNGNATFNNNGCSASTKLSIPQYVQLVQ